jgi:Cell division protein ZapA.
MPENDEFKIQLKVADKHYPLYCKRSDEWIFRRSATLINEKILKYSTAFAEAKLELKDLLVMVALQSFSEQVRKENEKDMSPLFGKIEELNKELEEYLRSNS